MTDSMIIKDGSGNIKSLTVESSSYGYIPVHAISSSAGSGSYVTASSAYPVYVTGNVSISQPVNVDVVVGDVITSSFPPVTSVSQAPVTSFVWNNTASGTFQIASNDTARKGLMIFNPGPHNLYVALSSTGGTLNGFTLVNTASAPSYYSFIIYPSGTFQGDSTNAGVNYGGYFISGSASSGVYVTSIS